MTVRISLIVAMAKNRVIGRGSELPWHISEDLKFFKRTTMGKPIVMGRKTYQSIGKALPGRQNIVVTRNSDFSSNGIVVASDLAAAMELAKSAAKDSGADEIMVIGGGEIYAAALPFADRIYLTEVDADLDGDAFMPELAENDWSTVDVSAWQTDETSGLSFRWVVLERHSDD